MTTTTAVLMLMMIGQPAASKLTDDERATVKSIATSPVYRRINQENRPFPTREAVFSDDIVKLYTSKEKKKEVLEILLEVVEKGEKKESRNAACIAMSLDIGKAGGVLCLDGDLDTYDKVTVKGAPTTRGCNAAFIRENIKKLSEDKK